MKKILLLTAVVLLFLFFWPSFFSHPSSGAPTVPFTIRPSATVEEVAKTLKSAGVFACQSCYLAYARFDSAARHPKPGIYQIKQDTNARALARMFAIGPARAEVEIKIIEGWSLKDEAEALKEYGVDPTVFFNESKVDSLKSEYDFLKQLADGTTLEGYLFPDTYRVWKDQLPQSLIRKQLEAFSRHATPLIKDANQQGRTLHDVVTLASIIEKEVAKPEDRKLVAGIFWNRLREKMPLQSDATVNYVTHASRARPTLSDLATASPYNTYQQKGLPPGPISNPGADAIEAALHPPRTAYRYFLTDAHGKTYVAKTFEEHIRNRWRAFGP